MHINKCYNKAVIVTEALYTTTKIAIEGLTYNMTIRLYFLQAVYLSVTFSQLITFQIAFR